MDRIAFLKYLSGVGFVAVLPPFLIRPEVAWEPPDVDALEFSYDCSCDTSERWRKIGCKPRCAEIRGRHFTGLFYPEISRVVEFSPHSFNPFVNIRS